MTRIGTDYEERSSAWASHGYFANRDNGAFSVFDTCNPERLLKWFSPF